MLKRFAAAVLLSAAVASSAGAVPVTYVMQGVVDSVSGVGTSVGVGDLFTATVTVETSTPGICPGCGGVEIYPGSVTSVAFSVGAYTGGTGAGWGIRIQDVSLGYDQVVLEGGFTFQGSVGGTVGGPLLDGNTPIGFRLEMQSHDLLGISSLALALPTDLTHFDSTLFDLFGVGIGGHITSIQVVPEPSLAALLGAGVLALALRRRAAA